MKRRIARVKNRVLLSLLVGTVGLPALSGCGGGGPPTSLIGVWDAQFVDPFFGPGAVQLILQANGRFQQQTVYAAGSLVTIVGTFRVFPNEALLRLDIEDGFPDEFCALECTPILYPAGESHGYTLVDNNTLVLQPVNCVPGAGVCVFNYTRTA